MATIGSRLKTLRKNKKLTINQFIEELIKQENNNKELKLTKQMVSKWENDKHNISKKYINIICKFYGTTENYLYYGKSDLLKTIENIYKIKEIIPKIILNEENKIQLLTKIEEYIKNNQHEIERYKKDYNINFEKQYNLPLSLESSDKDILNFAYDRYLINNEKILILFLDSPKTSVVLSNNKNIQDLQKEIIDITTKIDNVEIIEDIRDIAQLKLDKSNNNPK